MPRAGLPIAVYLGALVALALAAAFVAILSVVLWLPPRPPDVARADVISDHFQVGYDHMLVEGRPPQDDSMAWRVQDAPPAVHFLSPHLVMTRTRLASALSLGPDSVRVSASSIVRNETLVFRVRDGEELRRHAERAARASDQDRAAASEEHRAAIEAAREARRDALEALREAREAGAGVAIDGDKIVIELPSEADLDAQMRTFEFRIPEAPAPPAHVVVTPPGGAAAPSAGPAPPMPPAPPMFAPAPRGVMLISGFEFGAELPDGRWLVMRQGRNWAEIGWIARAAAIIGATLAALSLLAIFFSRRLTRPIRSFSDAVQAVGVDPQSAPVREEGPRELRGAARAVNTMQARLRALIADRTKTLAAVAHDMRTPLMRLRLAAENVPVDQRERMAKEIGEVEALVASFIAFARDDPAEEARVRLDLSALLQSIADDQVEAGRNVAFTGEERLVITAQSLGLKRLFNNLVENALKYGGSARISLALTETAVCIDIEDDGPGIPADERDSVFEPFVRLSEGASGAGLGLPAARAVARAHGGDVVVLDAERGAKVRVTLPR